MTKAIIDSGAEFSIITEKIAKHLGMKINGDDRKFLNTMNAISSIVRQVSNKKIRISLHQLLKIVKLEIQQEIIKSIANLDIPRRNHTPSESSNDVDEITKGMAGLSINDSLSSSNS
ncbi:4453_t:CDS:1 [Entrophospora sp. SA101]|nr:12417_t:CDS:1 [Entrophospora sp. SA101]CAJ0841811.1 4453_t:CDS:1 [Entrophospora sp. SA101]